MARVAHWFRTDLRLHDNLALTAALKVKNIEAFYPIWCWDPRYVYATPVGPNRWNFLLESMQDVSDSITELQPTSQLFVLRGSPMNILPRFFKECKITHLSFERDDEAYAIARDEEVAEIAKTAGVEIISTPGRTLFECDKVIEKNKGKIPTTYAQYERAASELGLPAKPLPAPEQLPPPGEIDFTTPLSKVKPDIGRFLERDINYTHREDNDKKEDTYESIAGPDQKFQVPTMQELGMKPATTFFRGGEKRALEVLEEWLTDRKEEAIHFEKPKTSPAAWKRMETTLLSPHIKFGCLSIRKFYWSIKDLIAKTKNASKPPVSLLGQITFRDFFHCAQYGTPNFERIRGNPVCRFIDWDLCNQYDEDGNEVKELKIDDSNREAHERFVAWRDGQTGYPWIDAQMRRLQRDGWIHHLARHSVACFLTRQLYISWERGAEVFDHWLVDWDPASNSANWMWLSASAFFNQYMRVYGPVSFGQKWDKTGSIIREYVPELKDMPDKYIFSPWTAPADVQKKAKCIVGKDYPKPIVDDKSSKAICIARIKRAYDAGLHGDDERVLDGTAHEYVRSLRDLPEEDMDEGGLQSLGKRKTREEADDEKKHVKQTKLKMTKK